MSTVISETMAQEAKEAIDRLQKHCAEGWASSLAERAERCQTLAAIRQALGLSETATGDWSAAEITKLLGDMREAYASAHSRASMLDDARAESASHLHCNAELSKVIERMEVDLDRTRKSLAKAEDAYCASAKDNERLRKALEKIITALTSNRTAAFGMLDVARVLSIANAALSASPQPTPAESAPASATVESIQFMQTISMAFFSDWICRTCGAAVSDNEHHGVDQGCWNPYPLVAPTARPRCEGTCGDAECESAELEWTRAELSRERGLREQSAQPESVPIAGDILAVVCNERKNSDIRADDKEYLALLDAYFAKLQGALRTSNETARRRGVEREHLRAELAREKAAREAAEAELVNVTRNRDQLAAINDTQRTELAELRPLVLRDAVKEAERLRGEMDGLRKERDFLLISYAEDDPDFPGDAFDYRPPLAERIEWLKRELHARLTAM